MSKFSYMVGIALFTGSTANMAMAASPCGPPREQIYSRKADLPRGAVEATRVAIAEVGGAYQRSDVVLDNGLPIFRFVSAARAGCRLAITYERGGFGHRWGTFSLSIVNGIWKLRSRS